MKKNENDSAKSPDSMMSRLFNGIKNSPKKPSKKAFGKIGLFLIFGFLAWNLNVGFDLKNYTEKEGVVNYFEYSDIYLYPSTTYATEFMDGLLGYGKSAAGFVIDNHPFRYYFNNVYKPTIGKAAGGASLAMINGLLSGVSWAISKITIVAGSLLDFALETDYLREMTKSGEIYKLWAFIRDILNLFFMILLLFSAFATIFQVEKYHLRKIIIMLVVMALLVNFSYPIALFIIDFSNSAMNFLLDIAFSDSQLVSKSSKISDSLRASESLEALHSTKSFFSGDMTGQLILLIIFQFIWFITLIALALNLLIRMIAFIILVIISPFGFVFAFFPGTSSLSNEWWSKIINYAFVGPILSFFILVVVVLFNRDTSMTLDNDLGDTGVPIFIIGSIFLWLGLSFSNKLGGAASGIAMGVAKNTGNKIKSYGQKYAWAGAKSIGRFADDKTGNYATGTIGAAKMKLAQWSDDHKSASNTRATQIAGRIGVTGANEKLVRENMKRMKDDGVSEAELTRMQGGSRSERMAAALFRAENNRFDNNPATALAQYTAAMDAVRGHQVYENQFLGGARKTNMDLVINERINTSGATTPAAMQTIIRDELGRLDPDQWRDQNIQRMVNGTTPNRGLIITEGAHVISGYSAQGQDNVTRNMRGVKLNAGSQLRNSGVGFWA